VDDDSTIDQMGETFLFHHLVAMFQTLALQQLGKFVSPITGRLERDLQQAKITIDMLQMIRDKTVGNLTGDEESLLDRVLWELQMNFVDEQQRAGQEKEEAAEEKPGEPEGTEAERTAGDDSRPAQQQGHEEKPGVEGKEERVKEPPGAAGAGKKIAPKARAAKASAKRKQKKKKKKD